MNLISLILLQAPATVLDATKPVTTAAASSSSISILELLMKGGWVMIPIGILSIIAVFIIIERFLFIHKTAQIDDNFIPNIAQSMYNGNLDSAIIQCRNANSSLGRIIEKGLSRVGRPLRDIESTVETMANIEIKQMEKNMSYLGIIAGIAPMLGFIGTILGIINIFYSISLSDNISIGAISGGLYQKMITSFAGLVVGVISYTGYHVLNTKIDNFTTKLEQNIFKFLDILQQPTK